MREKSTRSEIGLNMALFPFCIRENFKNRQQLFDAMTVDRLVRPRGFPSHESAA